MKYSKEIRAAKVCFTKMDKGLTGQEVQTVLALFGGRKEVALAFGVHVTTAKSWDTGTNKPNGRNKMAFNFILNLL